MFQKKHVAVLVRLVSWTILGLIALQFPLSYLLMGKNQSFTLFEFLAPVSGMLFGPWLGAIQVVGTKLLNVGLTDLTFTTTEILRLFPLAFAAIYFGSKKRFPAWVALVAIAVFIAHPIGRQVWFYSLYWLIPPLTSLLKQNPIANALGATFTAHAVGGALFIWAFNAPTKVWLSLIPIVAVERAFFTLGIVVTAYIVVRVLTHRFSPLPALRSKHV